MLWRNIFSNRGITNSVHEQPTDFKTCHGRFSHPIAAFFFLAFRVGALLMYLLGSIFTDNFTLVFVVTILLLAFDFWTVKNVSGRLLVGLRWWNEIQEDGSNKWVFESASVSLPALFGAWNTAVRLNNWFFPFSLIDKIMQLIQDYSGRSCTPHLCCGSCWPWHAYSPWKFRGWW